jgi:hypothetical protein
MASSSFGSGPYDRFLLWLSPDFEQAQKEEALLKKRLTRYFALKGCPEIDRDELTSKTIDRVLQKEDHWSQYKEPLLFCVGVARNIWREYLRRPQMDPITTDPPVPDTDADTNREELLQCMEKCLGKLPAEERQLITQYHEGKGRERIENRKRLAEEHGGRGNLRLKVCRISSKVRACMKDDLGKTRKN